MNKCKKHQNSDLENKYPRTFSTVLLREYDKLDIFSSVQISKLESIKENAEAEYVEFPCFVCLREAFDNNEIILEKYKEGNRNRAETREILLSEIRKTLHSDVEEDKKPTALCFSGGGIRSAIFNLGVLQGLAKHGLLDKFHYLSTVSGGGYIGGWLSAWILRNNNSVQDVQEKLNPENYNASNIEPDEIKHLRNYSNFMSPRLGLFSSDTLTLIAVYLRNLLLNWTVLLPIIAAALILPRCLYSIFESSKGYSNYSLVLILASGFGIFGTSMLLLARPSLKTWFKQNYEEDDIYLTKSADLKVFLWCFLPIIILAVLSVIYWFNVKTFPDNLARTNFVIFGIILFSGGLFPVISFIFNHYNKVSKKHPEDSELSVIEIPAIPITLKITSFIKNIGEHISVFIENRPLYFEMFFSVICGAVGGWLLYLASVYFDNIASPVYELFPETTESVVVTCLGVPIFLTVFLLAATLYIGLASKFTDDMDREWVSRFGGWVLIAIVGWMVVSMTVLFGHRLFEFGGESNILQPLWKKVITSFGGISGLFALIIGFSQKSSIKNVETKASWTDLLVKIAPQIAAPIFILVLFSFISFVTLSLLNKTVEYFGFFNPFIWLGIFILTGSVMGLFININKFSLHAIYRERIIRAFLGASSKKYKENANSFTGLDSQHDNVEMRDLINNKPCHVVNMTLNLSNPSNLAWQSRKAESFTVSPMYCGSSNMGKSGNYRPTNKYGGSKSLNKKPITLGTAVAISGAAANPNMGYYTFSSSVIFLMVLFNIRLGWWLGNTGLRGNRTWQYPTPFWSPMVFISEALGRTTDENAYINLSDGGHFDNLGLYEMVLRRCNLVVVCDAGADGEFSFSDLAQAIHKIRVDFGISIEFSKGNEPKDRKNCAIGTIKYSDVDGISAKNGTLIYIKPTLDGNESIDLINYKKKNSDFPHESTADQFFGETQFESYRTLGLHQIESICNGENGEFNKCQNLVEIRKRVASYIKKTVNKQNQKENKSESNRNANLKD
jgi:hypothetical protein